ncbi:MAG: hypothetical protein IJ046_04860 [Clostridia bacterium]|nr:hypothetical protein [Clostridia bacterium]
MKKLILSLLAIVVAIPVLFFSFVIFTLTRPVKYTGDHPELYTVAVTNVFGARGYTSNGEVGYSPDVQIIEEDDFGRVLFVYNERYWGDDGFGAAFVIMQMSDNDFAYFYDECCSTYVGEAYEIEKIIADADPDVIEELKVKNDWNCKPDPIKYKSWEIVIKKPKSRQKIEEYYIDPVIYEYAREHGYEGTDDDAFKYSVFSSRDKYGRELFYVYARTADDITDGETVYGSYDYAVIVDPEGGYTKESLVRIDDMAKADSLIGDLKAACGWDTPYVYEDE